MVGAKEATSTPLNLVDGTATIYSIEYRHIIGSLQHLSLTSLDISFALNKVS